MRSKAETLWLWLGFGVRSCRRQQADRAFSSPPLAQTVAAITEQSDPAKLATLGPRQANPRLKRIVFYLAQARGAGVSPSSLFQAAQKANGSAGTSEPAVESQISKKLRSFRFGADKIEDAIAHYYNNPKGSRRQRILAALLAVPTRIRGWKTLARVMTRAICEVLPK